MVHLGQQIRATFLFVVHTTLKIYEDNMIQTQHNNFILSWFRPP